MTLTLDLGTLAPIVAKLGGFFRIGLDHYTMLRAAGKAVDVDGLAVFIEGAMADWNPEVKQRAVLDDATKRAAARFLAGVVFNMIEER